MHDIYFYGPLRVIINTQTGTILAVQDRISGEAAIFRFSPAYIAKAEQSARLAHFSLADEV